MAREQQGKESLDEHAKGLMTPPDEKLLCIDVIRHCAIRDTNSARLHVYQMHNAAGAQIRNIQNTNDVTASIQIMLDRLTARMPAQRFSKIGLVPLQLTNASPLNSESLHGQLQELTVSRAGYASYVGE